MTDQTAAQHFGRLADQPPKKTGRPSAYSEEVAQRICQHIADGGYATDLQRFGLPHAATINRWLGENEAFRDAYARARQQRAETFADQIVEIADTEEDPQRARVRIDARKWIASKLFPRMYGENQRVEVEHTISETAARVLQDLSQRAKQRQAEQAKYIDVTPVPSLSTGEASPATSTGYDSSARVAHAGAPRALSPPAPATTVDPPLPEQHPLSTTVPKKNNNPRKKHGPAL